LIALLTDPDVIIPKLPDFLHRFLFKRIAKKRAPKISKDYELIGGKSPIFEDTEYVAGLLQALSFHRYLPATHAAFIEEISNHAQATFSVFPLFPQFSYSTTGSIARWFSDNLPASIVNNLKWVKSYAEHPAYIQCMVQTIQDFLQLHHLNEEETILLFSAHGLPKSYIESGDPYQKECELSFQKIAAFFPKAHCALSYQSKFGKGEWIRPYTDEFCQTILQPRKQDGQVVFIPLSFTSDHIETLFEIENLYLPLIRARGLKAYRLPALNRRADWMSAIPTIIQDSANLPNDALIRPS